MLWLFFHRDLYPGLARALQSVHRVLDPSDPLMPLQLQRVLALLSLLTQVTHTAGCHQELQAGVVRCRWGSKCFFMKLFCYMKHHTNALKSFLCTCYPLCFHYSSQGEECPPPPPVTWGHVTGLQASLLGHLKGFVKSLDNPVQKESSLAVIPAYLVYLEAYYHQLSRQVPLPAVYFLPVCVWGTVCVPLPKPHFLEPANISS